MTTSVILYSKITKLPAPYLGLIMKIIHVHSTSLCNIVIVPCLNCKCCKNICRNKNYLWILSSYTWNKWALLILPHVLNHIHFVFHSKVGYLTIIYTHTQLLFMSIKYQVLKYLYFHLNRILNCWVYKMSRTCAMQLQFFF